MYYDFSIENNVINRKINSYSQFPKILIRK